MWKFVNLGLGLFLMLASVAGVSSVFNGDVEKIGREIVEGGVETTGVITERYEHTVGARRGRIGAVGRYYTMKYEFSTLDGATFSDEINVTKDQAYRVQDGQEIRVRYYADQPSINSALGFEEYMTEEDVANLPIGTILFSSALMFFGGVWLAWSSWRKIIPAAAPSKMSARVSVAAQGPTKPMFGGR